MAAPLRLPRQAPRDPALLSELDLRFMLRVWGFISWLMLIFGVPWVLAGAIALAVHFTGEGLETPQVWGAMFAMALGWTALGLHLRRRNQGLLRGRKAAVLRGEVCAARLVDSRVALGLSASFGAPDTLLKIDVQWPGGTVRRIERKTSLPGTDARMRESGGFEVLVDVANEFVLVPELLTWQVEFVDSGPAQ